MRSVKHLTPRYIVNRIKELIFQQQDPNAPWLTKEAVNFLSAYLKETDCGFEWGSGRSTLWFARRVKKIISVESDKAWYDKVSSQAGSANKIEYYVLKRGLL